MKAWLYRKYHNYDKALVVLEEAMQLAVKRNNDLIVSRIIDELANTYYEMGKLDDAERSFRDLLQRYAHFFFSAYTQSKNILL